MPSDMHAPRKFRSACAYAKYSEFSLDSHGCMLHADNKYFDPVLSDTQADLQMSEGAFSHVDTHVLQ